MYFIECYLYKAVSLKNLKSKELPEERREREMREIEETKWGRQVNKYIRIKQSNTVSLVAECSQWGDQNELLLILF